MNHTIEDALEILGGTSQRIVNIRIDHNEINLIKSLARQVHRQIALTDRQLALSLKKIEKYKDGLEKNQVNVDQLLLEKRLKFPIREIDRSQSVYFQLDENKKTRIHIKYVFSKKFAQIWEDLRTNLIGQVEEGKSIKELAFNEKDLYQIVDALKPLGFEISDEVHEIYEKIEEILENPTNYAPHVVLTNDKLELKNVNARCQEYIDNTFSDVKDSDFLVFLERLKNCGIYHKNGEIIKKITQEAPNNLVKTILTDTSTRFRLNPEVHTLDSLIETISVLKQWPVLIIVEDKKDTISTVKNAVSLLENYIDTSEINVFFRLGNEDSQAKEFNQYVKDKGLNNFIGPNTKAVFITKNKIPKPLLNANWKPHTAVVACGYEYGKTSAYISSFPAVYYYNNNLNTRYSRTKGKNSIVEL